MHNRSFAHSSVTPQALAELTRSTPDDATGLGARLLGAICYAADSPHDADVANDAPVLQVCMPCLGGATDQHIACETWRGGAITQGIAGDVRYRHDDQLLFGSITIDEARFDASGNETPLQRAAATAYDQLFTLLKRLGFPHLYRVWNYLPQINSTSHGLERYRQFNLGRQAAHEAHDQLTAQDFPAACALGAADGPLAIAFIAGRSAPLRVENPRQLSAYHYPSRYGPRTPLFSRATLASLRDEHLLLISGTASVVGHETLHADDVVLQTRESLANLRIVLDQANRLAASMQTPRPAAPSFRMEDLALRVYVRHARDLASTQAELHAALGGTRRVRVTVWPLLMWVALSIGCSWAIDSSE